MPITINTERDFVRVSLDGKPSRSEFESSIPKMKEAISEQDQTSVLVELRDFEGWDLSSRWDRAEFEIRTFDEVRKVAFVGDPDWVRWMHGFTLPFRRAIVRFFQKDKGAEARDWLKTNGAAGQPRSTPNS